MYGIYCGWCVHVREVIGEREVNSALFPTKAFQYDGKCANSGIHTGDFQCSESVCVMSNWRDRKSLKWCVRGSNLQCSHRANFSIAMSRRRTRSFDDFEPKIRDCLLAGMWFVLGFIFAIWFNYYISVLYGTENHGNVNDRNSRGGRAFLFVAILSSHKTKHLRNAARQTWLKLAAESNHRIVYRFFVGALGVPQQWRQALEEESREFNDMVVFRYNLDSYDELTDKLLSSFDWIDNAFSFDYLLKLDDDSFARLDAIADDLATWKRDRPDRDLYWGFFSGNAPVFKSGKWAEPHWHLRDGYYLPYARGGGYVLSNRTVNFICHFGFYFDKYFSEDVSVGVWVAPLKIDRRHDRRFDTEYRSRGCFNSYLVTHKQTAPMMYKKYESLTRYGVLCEREVRSRLTYEYNWNVQPSACCIRNMTDASLRHQTKHWQHTL
ncbi:beta-1,3-galactosyltransferase 6-like [Amblyomma americanum]